MRHALMIFALICMTVLLGACPDGSGTSDQETSVPAASLSQVAMAEEVDSFSRPAAKASVFAEDISEICCCALVSDAPDFTEVSSEWIYIGGEEAGLENMQVGEQSLTVSGTEYIYFSQVRKSPTWPVGSYEVKLYLNGEEAATVNFEVEAEATEPEVKKLLVLNMNGWQSGAFYYVSGTVKNVGSVPLYDVELEATFYDEDGNVIKTTRGYLEPSPIGVWETAHAETEKVTAAGLEYYTYRFVLLSGEYLDFEEEEE